ncbi:LysM peptidoglycan-binding domain-containing protein [Mobilitalea sibirica]|uniref:LysM peptidoglycan-binding domain-containing protein n=1 Tax=Mobilitalea sibirica TaxID=1462919 RepID=A0A8J7H0N7_9FIRM|nr:LysM peptidoglycan-binding domain-containing protein [Mobilitalea sibirica]MBH1942039.1 LysM peptidoglycan-binding domain-containing protein [Mobilitalea sibirica]
MDIYVVEQGETISSIAESYGVSVNRLIQENELRDPDNLVTGQTIVITYPEETHTVQEGDTLEGIAERYNISVIQLYRNNSFLIEREYIYPGEVLVIRYDYEEKVSTIGYALPFINDRILRKTLPYLTYLFVYNYRLAMNGEVETFYDDQNIVDLSKAYGTLPIMLVTTLTARGTPNVQAAYEILLNEEIQDQLVENILQILREKGYYGFNMTFLYLTEANEELYNNFTRRVTRRLSDEGYLVFVTADPGIRVIENDISFIRINFITIGREVDGISFLSYLFGASVMPPAPVSSIANLTVYLDYVSTMVSSKKIFAGIQIIAYNWELPYVAGFSRANSLTISGAVELARDVGAVIQFDEVSQTPYFEYVREDRQHIVWFIDARTIDSLTDLITAKNFNGPSVWNIMDYYAQLWLVINSKYEIEKLI